MSAESSCTGDIGLSVAGQYNAFILGDFTGWNAYTKGRLAAGGNAVIDGYVIGQALDPATAGDVLVTGGDLTLTDSTVYHGDIKAGGSATADDSNYIQGELAEHSALPVDFAAAAQYLTDLSANLAAKPANGTYQYWSWGKIRLQGDGTSDLQVFHLDGGEVSNIEILDADDIPSGATLILNVDGANVSLTNAYMGALDAFSSRILFNFYQAASLNVSGSQVKGSILAPGAHRKRLEHDFRLRYFRRVLGRLVEAKNSYSEFTGK